MKLKVVSKLWKYVNSILKVMSTFCEENDTPVNDHSSGYLLAFHHQCQSHQLVFFLKHYWSPEKKENIDTSMDKSLILWRLKWIQWYKIYIYMYILTRAKSTATLAPPLSCFIPNPCKVDKKQFNLAKL